MSKCRSLVRGINPLLMMNRAGHRLFQQVAPGVCMHAAAGGEGPCFFVQQVLVGDPDANSFQVCYNTTPDIATCQTLDFEFVNNTQVDPFNLFQVGPNAGNCIGFEAGYLSDPQHNSSGPLDNIVMNYVPGTCHKSGDPDPECVLEAISNFPVTNNIWGPTQPRIGDISADLVIVPFPTTPAETGSTTACWEVLVNLAPRSITNAAIVNDTIRLTLASPVNQGDTVELSHTRVDGSFAARAVDGRYCYRFYQMPVLNVLGVSFWNREDAGPWLLDGKTHRWRLEN